MGNVGSGTARGLPCTGPIVVNSGGADVLVGGGIVTIGVWAHGAPAASPARSTGRGDPSAPGVLPRTAATDGARTAVFKLAPEPINVPAGEPLTAGVPGDNAEGKGNAGLRTGPPQSSLSAAASELDLGICAGTLLCKTTGCCVLEEAATITSFAASASFEIAETSVLGDTTLGCLDVFILTQAVKLFPVVPRNCVIMPCC